MAWIYIKSEPGLWTVGHHSPNGTWHTDSDHASPEAAAKRAAMLNGGPCRDRDIDELAARL